MLRREFLNRAMAASGTMSLGAIVPSGARESQAQTNPLVTEVDRAIRRGVDYLVRRQLSEGDWRSQVYGPFKDGTALTSQQLCALAAARDVDEYFNGRKRATIDRGMELLPVIGGRNDDFGKACKGHDADLRRRRLLVNEGIGGILGNG